MRYAILSVALFVVGCGAISEGFNEKLYPTPRIYKSAEIHSWLSEDRSRVDVSLVVRVDDAEKVKWVYYCNETGVWNMIDENPDETGGQQRISFTDVEDGKAENMRKDVGCMGELGIKVTAINNFNTKHAKKASMVFQVDIEELIARHAAKKANQTPDQ